MYKYSAIMSVKNGEKFIEESIESILNQSIKPSEIIVILDLCTDNTEKILEKYKNDLTIVKNSLSEKGGLPYSLNKGITLAKNDYITFLDSDDIWTANKNQIQIEIMEENQLVEVVSSNTVNFSGEVSEQDLDTLVKRSVTTRLLNSSTFRKKTFQNYGLLDDDNHFSFIASWWINAMKKGVNLHKTKDLVLLRRIHEKNSWVTGAEKGRNQISLAIRKIVQDNAK